MGLFDRYHQAPPSASGRFQHDVTLGIADVALNGMWALSGAVRKMAAPSDGDHPIALTVAARDVVAHDQDVVAYTLAASDGRPLPCWHPGAHIDVHLPSGLIRQYSLCGDPRSRATYRIAVRRIPDGGGGSVEVHDTLRIGASLTTHGPRNAFPLTVPGYGSPARRFRFIAAGIGITPILPMLATAQRMGVDWSMVYAGRSHDSLPFIDEVARFGGRVAIRTDDVSGLPTAFRAVRRAARRRREKVLGGYRLHRPDGRGQRRRDAVVGAQSHGGARAVLLPAGILRYLPNPGSRRHRRPP
jgi:ferredoxin-NADP reductase